VRRLLMLITAASLAVTLGCGSGSTGNTNKGSGGGVPSGANVQAVTIDGGPIASTLTYVNGLFTSVIICVPGTSTCQTVDHVLVDTGSYGLRVLAHAVDSGGLSLSLTTEKVGGNSVAECTQFADNSFLWGPVKTADVKISGEVASSIPIVVAGDAGFTKIPSACSSGGTNANSLNALGAHAILGIGVFPDDCGDACVNGPPPTPLYYACTSTTCNPTTVAANQLVANPVAAFARDNNGVIIQLPAISASGAGTTNGSMIFGIGTQSNNALPASAHFFSVNGFASFQTTYKGTKYGPRTQSNTTDSYIDSGSNGLFFPDSSIQKCPDPNPGSGFFCPPSPLNSLTATQVSAVGTSSNPVGFSIVSAQTLFNNGTAVAFDNLGGTNSGVFDWGLPFFYGRNVYNAIAGTSTPASVSTPYWAY
jgi:hypothetical protein